MPTFNKDAQRYVADARAELDRLNAVVGAFRRSNAVSERAVLVAATLEEGMKARLRERAEEARLHATTADSAMAQGLWLELADGYDGLASSAERLVSALRLTGARSEFDA